MVKTDSTFCKESPSSTSFRSEVFCSGVKETKPLISFLTSVFLDANWVFLTLIKTPWTFCSESA
ncbi:hypothetical protein JM47_01885 [Ureaplasma diversum]|uniref:Uncharacterized protein n=1 Tax=Ureaplasma diversum TaxID=42094 RepID=A0A0C5RLP3_9BACT|nr:hypothetical protein JM47_01885 [Ureaplasma diversum]